MRTTLASTVRFPAASLLTTSLPTYDSPPLTWACAETVGPTSRRVPAAVAANMPLRMRFIVCSQGCPPLTLRVLHRSGHSLLLPCARTRPATFVILTAVAPDYSDVRPAGR